MKIVSAPYYFEYFRIGSTFNDDWMVGLSTDWKETLDDPEDADNYYCWPEEWVAAYKEAVHGYQAKIRATAEAGQIYRCGEMTLYDAGNEIFASTPYHGHGDIDIVEISDDSNFDSAETAFYAFINDYRDWEKSHKSRWDAANILSGADPGPATDSVICELCGSTFSIPQGSDGEMCNECANR